MKIPNSGEIGKVTCFNSDGDTLCVGTEDGFIIVWNVDDDREGFIVTATRTEIEQIFVTKNRIVAVDSGSVLVFSSMPDCTLIFCKKLETCRILVSVSWHVGEEKMALACQESGPIDILSLSTGLIEQVIELEENCMPVKIAFLKYPNNYNRMCIGTKNTSSELEIRLFDIKSLKFGLSLNVHPHFNPDFQVYTILSPSGVILFGRQFHDDFLPYTCLAEMEL